MHEVNIRDFSTAWKESNASNDAPVIAFSYPLESNRLKLTSAASIKNLKLRPRAEHLVQLKNVFKYKNVN